MNWRFIKAFPKYAIVIGTIVISTALFALWWRLRQPAKTSQKETPSVAAVEIQKKAASLPAKLGWLALVGSDLYDVSNGELLFRNWLGGIPQRLFYQPEANRLMVQTERGILRFAMDGKQDGVMGQESPPAFTNDGKIAMFVKGGDVWIAEPDWNNFVYVNERQATKYGQFNPLYFSANVSLASEKACLVKQQNKLLRADLLTGDVQEIKKAFSVSARTRSPDCKAVFGDDGEKFFAYDIDKNEVTSFPKNHEWVVSVQWLTNDTCAYIVGGKNIRLYDRKKNEVVAISDLPFDCRTMSLPSPDGRYVLCNGKTDIAVVDFAEKRVTPLGIKASHIGWVGNDTLIYSRDVPDMAARGTWIVTLGKAGQRVISQPYMVGNDGIPATALLPELDLTVFATQDALFRIKTDGSEVREIAKLPNPVGRIQAVEMWGE